LVSLGRNRSEGWRHAKLDGHANEERFAKSLLKNQELVSIIENQIIKDLPKGKLDISVDGAKHVDSIFGDKTTSKVDLAMNWSSGEQINISLKKSSGGQAWLISVPRFMSVVEFYLNCKLDSEVKMGISLFIGGANLVNYEDYFNKCLESDKGKNPIIAKQEIHQRRLVAISIESNFPSVWEATLNFFNTNIALITRLSFAQGLAKSEKDAADVIIYNKAPDGKSVFPISRIVNNVSLRTKSVPVIAGSKNGGSTLQLPTGSLQMHHPQGENLLQFRHDYKKISTL
jgi:hypothetical protein